MAFTVPAREPDLLYVGDTWTWSKSLAAYPASTWTLSYALVNQSATTVSITAAADGDDHLVDEAPGTTAAYTAGIYQWQAYVTDGTDRHTIGYGVVDVLSNFDAQAGPYDARSHYLVTLEAVRAVLQRTATLSQASISIGDMSIGRRSEGELRALERRYAALYERELAKVRVDQGRPRGNRVGIQF